MNSSPQLRAFALATTQASYRLYDTEQGIKSVNDSLDTIQANFKKLTELADLVSQGSTHVIDLINDGKKLAKTASSLKDRVKALKAPFIPTVAQRKTQNTATDSTEPLKNVNNSESSNKNRSIEQKNRPQKVNAKSKPRRNKKQKLKTGNRPQGNITRHPQAQPENATGSTPHTEKNSVGKGQKLIARVRKGAGTAKVFAQKSAALAQAFGEKSAEFLKPGYDFSQKNAELQASLGLNSNSTDASRLKDQARHIADTTPLSPAEATDAQLTIKKLGGNKDTILAAAPTTVAMSQTNGGSIEDNAAMLLKTRDAFGLASSALPHLGDVITTTLQQSETTFDGFKTAIDTVAPVAKSAGMSVEETSVMLGALAHAGITGSEAGNGSLAVLESLKNPTEVAQQALGQLGVTTVDASGQAKSLFAVLDELHSSFKRQNIDASQRDQYMNTLFGPQGATSANALMTQSQNGTVSQLTDNISNADGSVNTALSVRQNSLSGDISALQSSWEGLRTDIFTQQDGAIRDLTQSATHYLSLLDQWIQKNPAVASTIGNILAAAETFASVVATIGSVAQTVISAIDGIMSAGKLIGPLFITVFRLVGSLLSLLMTPVGLIALGVAAVVGGGYALWKFFSGNDDAKKKLNEAQDRMSSNSENPLLAESANKYLSEHNKAKETLNLPQSNPITDAQSAVSSGNVSADAGNTLGNATENRNYTALAPVNNRSYTDSSVINNNVQVTVPEGSYREQIKQYIDDALNKQAQEHQNRQLNYMTADALN